MGKKSTNQEILSEMEDHQAAIIAKLEATTNVINRVLVSDLGSFNVDEDSFLNNYKNGISELNIVESALILLTQLAQEVYDDVRNLELTNESGILS